MTDQQKHQAIEKVIKATVAQIDLINNQLQLLAAHVDLLKTLNEADTEADSVKPG